MNDLSSTWVAVLKNSSLPHVPLLRGSATLILGFWVPKDSCPQQEAKLGQGGVTNLHAPHWSETAVAPVTTSLPRGHQTMAGKGRQTPRLLHWAYVSSQLVHSPALLPGALSSCFPHLHASFSESPVNTAIQNTPHKEAALPSLAQM